jgi:competence protein ComEA
MESSTKQDILKAFYPTFIGVLIGLVLGGVLWIVTRAPSGNAVLLMPPPTPLPLVVDVAGAVPRPGVYDLPKGSRVKDAVEAAGGFLAEADRSTINMAKPVADGEQLTIPYLPGTEPLGAPQAFETPTGKININEADAATLMTLKGIGEKLAQNIIAYREGNGPFYFIEDIMYVDGIGEDIFNNIKDLIMTGYE